MRLNNKHNMQLIAVSINTMLRNVNEDPEMTPDMAQLVFEQDHIALYNSLQTFGFHKDGTIHWGLMGTVEKLGWIVLKTDIGFMIKIPGRGFSIEVASPVEARYRDMLLSPSALRRMESHAKANLTTN